MYQQEAGCDFVSSLKMNIVLWIIMARRYICIISRLRQQGDSVDYERKVSIAVVENDTNYVNTARPEQYKLLEGVVPAGLFLW